MYVPLGQERLKSGEWMAISVVQTPDPEWAPRLTAFLQHKGEDWLPQIIAALAGPLDDLATRFYVGQIDGQLACQTMVATGRGVGLVSHVFTRPEDRRKGAIQALLTALMADCRRTGVSLLTLGTEFESPAYQIYRALGFQSVGPGRGEMIWRHAQAPTPFPDAPGPVTVRPVRWDDWGFFNALAVQPVGAAEELPRSPLLGLKAQGSVEGTFLRLMAQRQEDPQVQALALVVLEGPTVGWGLLDPDPAWFGDAWRLDLNTFPAFQSHFPTLLAALTWPDAPVCCPLTRADGPKAAALRAAGFHQAARLPGWLEHAGRHDLLLFVRP